MSGIIVKRVESEEEINALKKLRYKIYCEQLGWIKHDKYPDGIEQDAYDNHSIHFGAFKDGKAIGAIRLIKENPTVFPIHSICDLWDSENSKLKDSRTSEISRLIVDTSIEKMPRSAITLGLIKQLYYASKYHEGITHWYASFDVNVHRLIGILGFKFSPLGAPVYFMGSKTVPAILSKSELDAHLSKNNDKLYKYLNSPKEMFYNTP